LNLAGLNYRLELIGRRCSWYERVRSPHVIANEAISLGQMLNFAVWNCVMRLPRCTMTWFLISKQAVYPSFKNDSILLFTVSGFSIDGR